MPHTPGPWFYREQGEANSYAITHYKERRKAVDWLLALQHNGEQLDEEQRANMQLICAAPELLVALQDAWDFIENVTDDDPGRNDKFFELRAKVREAFYKVRGD